MHIYEEKMIYYIDIDIDTAIVKEVKSASWLDK